MWSHWSITLLAVTGVKSQDILSWYDNYVIPKTLNSSEASNHSSYSSHGMPGYGMYKTTAPIFPILSRLYEQPMELESTTEAPSTFASRLVFSDDNETSASSTLASVSSIVSSTPTPSTSTISIPPINSSSSPDSSTTLPLTPNTTTSEMIPASKINIGSSTTLTTTDTPTSSPFTVPATSENILDVATSLPYPTYSEVPQNLNFSCKNRTDGYYADQEADCQVWHWCIPGERHYTFLCPNQTLFNQAFLVCDWWYNVDCDSAKDLYSINEKLYATPPEENDIPTV